LKKSLSTTRQIWGNGEQKYKIKNKIKIEDGPRAAG
jgi:hypothetical protein